MVAKSQNILGELEKLYKYAIMIGDFIATLSVINRSIRKDIEDLNCTLVKLIWWAYIEHHTK